MPIEVEKLSVQDALDLAILMEEEARQRYEEFTGVVGGRYPGDAADMFRMMARYETAHRDELVERRRALFGDEPRRLTLEMLDDVEAPDRGQPRVYMSAREAMEVALASEQKAYDFFDGALRHVTDPGVKALFEELRLEELRHRDLVQAQLEPLPPGPDVDEETADEPGMDPGN